MEKLESSPVLTLDRKEISHNGLKKVFYDEEHEGFLWRMKFIEAYFNGDFNLAEKLAQGEDISIEKFYIDTMLDNFTANREVFLSMLGDDYFTHCDFIKCVTYDENNIEIYLENGVISAVKISSAIPQTIKMFPDINKMDRIGKCHMHCVTFAKNFDLECAVASGYVAPLAQKNRNLHSWIEFNFCGEDVVLDFTKGLMFNKSGYYLLKNIRGPVQRVSRERIVKDLKMLQYFANVEPFLNKLYFANRQQAVYVYNKFMECELLEKIIKTDNQ